MADYPTPNDKQQPPSSTTSPTPPGGAVPPTTSDDPAKWGTHLMGHPSAPTSHPDNQKAAALGRAEDSNQNPNQPDLDSSPTEKSSENPHQSMTHMFNSWSKKAETMARNVWHNLKTGHSMPETAWGKLNLNAKALTGGGFESLFKQIFETDPQEKLKKTFACYFSTTTGPVAGTIYLSTAKVAFSSDRPLSFKAPSGQETWSYYKAVIPLGNVANLNPVAMRENHPPEKYVHIVTVDGQEFWFMGFVNYEKASHHLLDSISDYTTHNSDIPQNGTSAHDSNIPQTVTSGHNSNIPETVTSGHQSNIPETATSEHRSNIPETATSEHNSNIPETVTSAHDSNVPQTVTSGHNSNIPETVTSGRNSNIPETATSAHDSNVPQTVSSGHNSNIPQTVTSASG